MGLTVKELFSCLEGMKSGRIPGLFCLIMAIQDFSRLIFDYEDLLLRYTVITNSQLSDLYDCDPGASVVFHLVQYVLLEPSL